MACSTGHSMAAMVVAERHLWLNLLGIKKRDKAFLMDTPIAPSGFFGCQYSCREVSRIWGPSSPPGRLLARSPNSQNVAQFLDYITETSPTTCCLSKQVLIGLWRKMGRVLKSLRRGVAMHQVAVKGQRVLSKETNLLKYRTLKKSHPWNNLFFHGLNCKRNLTF